MNITPTPNMIETLKDHQLTCVCNTEPVQVFRMAREGTRVYCLQLAFTPEGIHITGDISLGRDQSGIGTVLHKPLGWFIDTRLHKSPGYLCEKFLRKEFQPVVAADDAQKRAETWAEEADDCSGDDAEAEANAALAGHWLVLKRRIEAAEDRCDAQKAVEEAYHGYLSGDSDGFEDFGYEYPLHDARWLCAIQKRFAELYHLTFEVDGSEPQEAPSE